MAGDVIRQIMYQPSKKESPHFNQKGIRLIIRIWLLET